jgi:isoleucyl-tRNA synthetase
MTTEELLPDEYRDKASEYRKGTDTMDVWFDSGRILSFTVTLITFFL